MADDLVAQSHAVPGYMKIRIVPDQVTGKFACVLSHPLAGVLNVQLVDYLLDYEATPAGSEDNHPIIGLSFSTVLRPEVVTNMGDSGAIHLHVDHTNAHKTKRIYFVRPPHPFPLQRSTIGTSSGRVINGRVEGVNDAYETASIAPDEYPTIILTLLFHSENAF